MTSEIVLFIAIWAHAYLVLFLYDRTRKRLDSIEQYIKEKCD